MPISYFSKAIAEKILSKSAYEKEIMVLGLSTNIEAHAC